MDPSKVEAITSWRLPRTIKDLRGFLGLTGYYRKLKQHYGKIVEPLTALLRKDAFQWTVAASIAFQNLKTTITIAPVFVLPNFSITFEVECDASGSGLGAVLMQQKRPIAFFSKALHGKKLLLSTY